MPVAMETLGSLVSDALRLPMAITDAYSFMTLALAGLLTIVAVIGLPALLASAFRRRADSSAEPRADTDPKHYPAPTVQYYQHYPESIQVTPVSELHTTPSLQCHALQRYSSPDMATVGATSATRRSRAESPAPVERGIQVTPASELHATPSLWCHALQRYSSPDMATVGATSGTFRSRAETPAPFETQPVEENQKSDVNDDDLFNSIWCAVEKSKKAADVLASLPSPVRHASQVERIVRRSPTPQRGASPKRRWASPPVAEPSAARTHEEGWQSSPSVRSALGSLLSSAAVAPQTVVDIISAVPAAASAVAAPMAAVAAAAASAGGNALANRVSRVPIEEPDSPPTPEGSPEELAVLELINAGSADDLLMLKGVGKTLAKKVVAHRDKNGPLTSIDDLVNKVGVRRHVVKQMLTM